MPQLEFVQYFDVQLVFVQVLYQLVIEFHILGINYIFFEDEVLLGYLLDELLAGLFN